jgi:hypothetical protein
VPDKIINEKILTLRNKSFLDLYKPITEKIIAMVWNKPIWTGTSAILSDDELNILGIKNLESGAK